MNIDLEDVQGKGGPMQKDEPPSKIVIVPEEKLAKPPETRLATFRDSLRGGLGWPALALVGLASLLLAAGLALGILAIVNKGLSYGSAADVEALQSQAEELQEQVAVQQREIADLKTRLEQLEEQAARATELERMALQLQGEIDKRLAQVEEVKGSVQQIQERLTEMLTQNTFFQDFIASVRQTLGKILPQEQVP